MLPKYDQDHLLALGRHSPGQPEVTTSAFMPYPANHRDAVRARIVRSARRLFNRHGFDKVSVDQIMSAAGLTRGGFYKYFASKSDLYVEALACFFTDPG